MVERGKEEIWEDQQEYGDSERSLRAYMTIYGPQRHGSAQWRFVITADLFSQRRWILYQLCGGEFLSLIVAPMMQSQGRWCDRSYSELEEICCE